MAIRAGMVSNVNTLRALTDTATDEYAVGGETYWSDDHLQNELDSKREDIYREPLAPVPSWDSGNNVRYYDYYFARENPETALSGTAAWLLQDSNSAVIGTASYTVNYDARHIRFTADTGGTVYYLTYRTYDLNRAAADVWMKKAANVANRFDVRTDNHDLKRSQLRTSFLDMANQFRRMAGGRLQQVRRVDVS